MAISKFLSDKWSTLVENVAIETSIAGIVTSNAYQMEANGSKSVKINFVGDITIGDYTPDTDITVQVLSDTQKTLQLNQNKYFAFSVDRLNMAKAQGDFMTAASEKAGKTIALEADKYVFGVSTYGDVSIPAGNKFGAIAASIALTTGNIEEYLSKMATALRKNHVVDGGYVVLPPEAMDLIRRAGVGSVTDNSDIWGGRTVGKYAGLDIVESTELTEAGTGTDEFQILAFSKRAIPMAVALEEMSAVEAEKRFGWTVKGLYSFGSKVIFPAEVSVLSATIA